MTEESKDDFPSESWDEDPDKKEIEDFCRDKSQKLADRDVLRAKNLSAADSRLDETTLRKLDSTLKKNTAFIRKLKNFTDTQKDVILRDFFGLNLSKYVQEIAASLVEVKLKMSDISAALEISSAAHQRYADFSGCFLDEWKKVLPRKKNDTVSNRSKLRVDIRFFSDLISVGIFEEKDALPILGGLLGFLINKDKEIHANLAIVLNFCKFCGDTYAGLIPRKMRLLAEKYNLTIPESTVIGKEKQINVLSLLADYYNSLAQRALTDCKALRKMERLNHKSLNTKGEVHPEALERYQTASVAFDKLWANCETFADLLDRDLPELPEQKVGLVFSRF